VKSFENQTNTQRLQEGAYDTTSKGKLVPVIAVPVTPGNRSSTTDIILITGREEKSNPQGIKEAKAALQSRQNIYINVNNKRAS